MASANMDVTNVVVDCETSSSGCSLWKLLCFCRSMRWNKSGSEASLLKNGLPSSVCASRRTLTSQDNIIAGLQPLADDVAQRTNEHQTPSYCNSIGANMAYSADRTTSSQPSPPQNGSLSSPINVAANPDMSTTDNTTTSNNVTVVPKGGKRCQLTIVQNIISGVSSVPPSVGDFASVDLPTNGKETIANCVFEENCHSPKTDNCESSLRLNGERTVFETAPAMQCVEASQPGTVTNGRVVVFPTDDSLLNRHQLDPPFSNEISIDNSGKNRGSRTDVAQSSCNGHFSVATPSDTNNVQKDANYYLMTVDEEESRLHQLRIGIERLLSDNNNQSTDLSIPEEVEGKMRSAVGKANLLTSQKFKQFRDLCYKNLNQSVDDPFATTVTDLAGFWDMVLLQVADVVSLFDELRRLQQANWQSDESATCNDLPATENGCTTSKQPAGPPKVVRAARRGRTPQVVKTTKTDSTSDTARSRDIARQRLMAAKMAGRQRKLSESDKDKDIEIFVS